MTLYRIIKSGSAGNAVIYHEEVLVDVGVLFNQIVPFLGSIKYLLLTHEHKDHLNLNAILTVATDYPNIKILGTAATIEIIKNYGVENAFELEAHEWYDLGGYEIMALELKHNVPTVGYMIDKKEYTQAFEKNGKLAVGIEYHRTFHATDTGTLTHIEAKGMDLYAIEFNHDEDLIKEAIEYKKELRAQGKKAYIHEYRSMKDHQSNQAAQKWLDENDTKNAIIVKLHVSDKYGGQIDKDQPMVMRRAESEKIREQKR